MTDSAISNQLNNMEEPPVVNNQYKPKNIFQEDQSFIDFDTVYNADETINNFYLNETDGIDFSSEEFNTKKNHFLRTSAVITVLLSSLCEVSVVFVGPTAGCS